MLILRFVRLVALDDFGLGKNWVGLFHRLGVLLSVSSHMLVYHLLSVPKRRVLVCKVWLVITQATVTFIVLVLSLILLAVIFLVIII